MDLSETQLNILMGILVIAFMALNIFIRRRRATATPMGKVVAVFNDINKNLRKTDTFTHSWRTGKFNTANWHRYQGKMDFLPMELRQKLAVAFDALDDVNGRIEAARQRKSNSYMEGIDADKLRGPLIEAGQQLRVWAEENAQNPENMPRRRGFFG